MANSMILALNNLQRLICRKIPTNQPTNQPIAAKYEHHKTPHPFVLKKKTQHCTPRHSKIIVLINQHTMNLTNKPGSILYEHDRQKGQRKRNFLKEEVKLK